MKTLPVQGLLRVFAGLGRRERIYGLLRNFGMTGKPWNTAPTVQLSNSGIADMGN
jgi:hypothetical protein